MVGGLCNIANVMSKLQISGWVGTMIEPLLGDLIARPYLFIFALVVTIYLVRYVIYRCSHAVGTERWHESLDCYDDLLLLRLHLGYQVPERKHARGLGSRWW